MYSRATFLRGLRYPIKACSLRPTLCSGPSIIQYRGVKIHRFQSEARHESLNPEENMERSYNLLLSETERDIKEQEEVAAQEAQLGQVDGESLSSKWDRFKQKYNYPKATHTLRDLDHCAIGETIVLHGYLRSVKVMKSLVFSTIFDHSGGKPVQIVSFTHKNSRTDELEIRSILSDTKAFTPVAVIGKIKLKEQPKGSDQRPNENRPSARDIEISPEAVYILNEVADHLMFTKDSTFTLAERHLQLRTDRKLQNALRARAQVAAICRSELTPQGFLEVETPLLFKSTPEGAREFLVPTRQPGMMYALPQSPQQYKQILMASGVQKYFQFAKCFRDEDLRADRQPEFTQLDLEMAFSGAKEVMAVMSGLVRRIWRDRRSTLLSSIPMLPYDVAIRTYGSDKPDLRYSHSKIQDVTAVLPHLQNGNPDLIVEAFALELCDSTTEPHLMALDVVDDIYSSVFSRKEFMAKEGELPIISFRGRTGQNLEVLQETNQDALNEVRQFLRADDDQIVVIQARPRIFNGGSTRIGQIRDALLRDAYELGVVFRNPIDQLTWIVDFPLFKPNEESEPGQGGSSGLSSTHHPFTAPRMEDIHLLQTDPLKVRAEHYDLVVNGVELGGGSARIHDPELQLFILKDVIKIPEERLGQFDHLLTVLASGCPPHAGIALGYDRLIAILQDTESVRDVIAFPKNGKGHDPLVGSPTTVSDSQLETYFLKHA